MEGIEISLGKVGARRDVAMLSVTGYVDTMTCSILLNKITENLNGGSLHIIIDMSRVNTVKELVSRDLHFLSLGPGIDRYLKEIQVLHEKYPDKIVFDATGDSKLLHLAGAGSDFFLVPSCSVFGGLAPMCFLTYGTIPLVPNLPVFRDFVMDMDSENSNGNGVVFDQASPAGIVSGIDRAIAAYADKESWKKNIETAMGKDFSWQAPTHEYLKLYQKLVSGKVRP